MNTIAEVHPPLRARRNSGIPRPIDISPALHRVVNSPRPRNLEPRNTPARHNGEPNHGISANTQPFLRKEIHTLHRQDRDGDMQEFRQFAQTANMRFDLPELLIATGNEVRNNPVTSHREIRVSIEAGAHRELQKTHARAHNLYN